MMGTHQVDRVIELASPGEGMEGLAGPAYFDLMAVIGAPGILGPPALKVKAERGICISNPLALASCGFTANGPATIPNPVSTKAWPLEPALEPSRGISFLAWKLRGLRPRTTMGAVVDSVSTTLLPLASVATTLRWSTKCCCSSFLLPLFAVALNQS